MPFQDDQPVLGPMALPEGFDLNPEAKESDGSVIGAALSLENPVASRFSSAQLDDSAPYDPTYRPYEDIQGTIYEQYSDRFVKARNADQGNMMKAQIDRELEDRNTIDAAGGWGFMAEMMAAVLSPTSLLPGGAVVKGAQGGVRIGKTAMSVSMAGGFAAAMDEIALHDTQETRTGEETGFAIGGGLLLGGLLGGAAGSMSRKAYMRSSASIERVPEDVHDFDAQLRSVGAAENAADMTVRNEETFQFFNKSQFRLEEQLGKVLPEKLASVLASPAAILRPIVRSDPILRAIFSDNNAARRALVDIVETPMQYKVNEQGQTVTAGNIPVETAIKVRRNNELAGTIQGLKGWYAKYVNDGEMSKIGSVTMPITSAYRHLMNEPGKMSETRFYDEVYKAAISNDAHPIPQVAAAAQMIRKNIFDPALKDATEFGLFDADLKLKHGESYATRNYLPEKIKAHWGDGTADDMSVVLREEFMANRAAAQKRLDEAEADSALKGADAEKRSAIEKESETADQFYASKSDEEITDLLEEAMKSIVGLKVGEHSFKATMASPRKARTLDVPTERLLPWIDTDMGRIMGSYFNSMVPDIEIARMENITGVTMTERYQRIIDDGVELARKAKSAKAKKRHIEEAEARVSELKAMTDRITGRYGVPDNPNSAWVRANRTFRSLSYTGYLGGMTLSAIPDVAGVIGRNGMEAAFGFNARILDHKRFKMAMQDVKELGAGAEWYLNSRAQAIADVMDDYGSTSRWERGLSHAGTAFGTATGMVPWNAGWKMIGSVMASSKMSKAAVAVKEGRATKKQLLNLSANGIDTVMAKRIADQIDKFGDKNGTMWLAQGRLWDDADAVAAFQAGITREMDIMIVTPGQDKPIAFSTETGKFFSQFKSFVLSAHHRVLLAGLQRRDAEVAAQFVTAVALGGMVSHIKADLGGYDRKEGAAFWEDAVDKSGLPGWLMEAHGLANAAAGGRLSLSGEETSRFGSRSAAAGLLGPSLDMGLGAFEGVSAGMRGEMTDRDARKVLRPVPGNNLPYLQGIMQQVRDAVREIGN